ncbi:MAG TPA: Ig-like domain-containing protein, partial [Panacibacter sp.]|nr:Ig-like domain-containing protein [Panacibacter sp.]
GTPPTISITSPVNNAGFTEPATITINTDAADIDGTVSKVEYFSGATLIGTDNTSPFSFDWTGVAAGNYTLTAKATDNSSLSTISLPVNVVVSINNSGGFCGTLENGDYSYKVETVGNNVLFQFHPLQPIAGCAYALIYIREGLTGGYPGYGMTAIGADFTFSKVIPNGTPISIYFTYQTPPAGERNSSATPHSYIVGTICDGILPIALLSFNAALQADGNVAINWSTAAEVNNDHFLVEKSSNGRSYSTLSKVAAGNSPATTNDYKVLDKYPVKGINYYRLTQFDKDGRSFISGIKTVNVNKVNTGISVYPNPLNGRLINIQLSSPAVNKLSVRLLNIAGKVIYNGTYIPQAGTLQVILPSKPAAGLYMLAVEGYAPIKLMVN